MFKPKDMGTGGEQFSISSEELNDMGRQYANARLQQINEDMKKQSELLLSVDESKHKREDEAVAMQEKHAELLNSIVEKQDEIIAVQQQQSEDGRKNHKWVIATAIIAALTLLATCIPQIIEAVLGYL